MSKQQTKPAVPMSIFFWELATSTHETDPIRSTDESMKKSTAAAKQIEEEACNRRLCELSQRATDDLCSVRTTSSTSSALTLLSVAPERDEDEPTDDLEFWEVALEQ